MKRFDLDSVFKRLARNATAAKVAEELAGDRAVERLLRQCGYAGRPEGLAARLEMELPLALPLAADQRQARFFGSLFDGPGLMAQSRREAARLPPRPEGGGPLPAGKLRLSPDEQHRLWPWLSGQIVTRLARAWLIAGEADFLSAVERQMRDFHIMSPPLMGPGWVEATWVATRVVNWLWALRLVGVVSRLEAAVTAQAVVDLRVAGMVLAGALETAVEPGLEHLPPAVALMHLGRSLSFLPESGHWLKLGAESAGPALAAWDRVGPARPTMTTATAGQWGALGLWLARKAGLEASGLAEALWPVAACCRAGAPPWGCGQAWGWAPAAEALRLDVGQKPERALAWPANLAALLLGEPELRADRQLDEPLFWLMGHQAVEGLRRLAWAKPPEAIDAPAMGLSSLCLAAGDRRAEALFRTGPRLASDGYQWQAQALAVSFCLDGRPLLLTPGPAFEGPLGPHLRSRQAQNAALLDGARPGGGVVTLEGLEQTETHAFAAASYDGYRHLAGGPILRRRVFIDGRRGLLSVVDQVVAKAQHTLELFFHLPPEAQVQRQEDGMFVIGGAFGVVLMRVDAKAGAELLRGRLDPPLGWLAVRPGSVEPTWVVRVFASVVGQARLTTSFVWGEG